MARFLTDADYDMQIRVEIKRLLDGSAPGDAQPPLKLLRAERTAISQIRKYLGSRVDCDAMFNATAEARDEFIVTITIDIALYHLYSQTGSRDIPKHRQDRYGDALEWLKLTGTGEMGNDLPTLPEDDDGEPTGGELRWTSYPPENHRY